MQSKSNPLYVVMYKPQGDYMPTVIGPFASHDRAEDCLGNLKVARDCDYKYIEQLTPVANIGDYSVLGAAIVLEAGFKAHTSLFPERVLLSDTDNRRMYILETEQTR